MKKNKFLALVFVILAVITACELLDECVQSCHENNAGYSKSDCEEQCGIKKNNNTSENSPECNDGEQKCDESGSYSLYCVNGSWGYDGGYMKEHCLNGCDLSTGKCKSNSGSENSESSGESSDGNSVCTSGNYKCEEENSYYCSDNRWTYDKYCPGGCNSSTGKCNAECSDGDYRCFYGVSQKCSGEKWTDEQDCFAIGGCNDETGKCRTEYEIQPCPPKMNAYISGGSVSIRWSYPTSAGCGTPITTMLKYYDSGIWIEIKSASASSFTSATLSVSDYGYYDENAGQTLLKAGIFVENDAAEDNHASCYCFIDENKCYC